MLALHDLQTSFFRSIAASPGPSASEEFDPALVRVVEGRGPLGPVDRLDIYAQMYWARLHDVLSEDFPRVAAILGAERFDAVVRTYLARNPSLHPSVRHVGERFAAFLALGPEIEGLPFLADLARLEWARLAVFDAPDAQRLRVDDLGAVALPEWPRLIFRLVPAVQLLHSAWPVHELWAAAEEGGPPEGVRPTRTSLRVWRDGFMVYQASMGVEEHLALGRVICGEPFASVCAALESVVGSEEAVREAAQLLLRWIEDGILAVS
ncbi:MAG: DNA-binding domain-containing protein [Candidatus Binatia bacterium]